MYSTTNSYIKDLVPCSPSPTSYSPSSCSVQQEKWDTLWKDIETSLEFYNQISDDNQNDIDYSTASATPHNHLDSFSDSSLSNENSSSTSPKFHYQFSNGPCFHTPNRKQKQQMIDEINYNKMSVMQILSLKLDLKEICEAKLLFRLILNNLGSRALQNIIATRTVGHSDISYLVNQCILEHNDKTSLFNLTMISEDVYGNYVMQKIIEYCSENDIIRLLHAFVLNNIVQLSQSKMGSRTLQKLLGVVNNADLLCTIVNSFEQNVLRQIGPDPQILNKLITSSTASYVIGVIINSELDIKYVQFLQDELKNNLELYCQDEIGCRMVQFFAKVYGTKSLYTSESELNYIFLSKTKFGNFVIQCMMENDIDFKNKLVNHLLLNKNTTHNLFNLSKTKYGSRVIEKCVKLATTKQISKLIKIFYTLQEGPFVLSELVNHSYGKYIIKSLLNQSNDAQKTYLTKLINYYCPNRYYNYK